MTATLLDSVCDLVRQRDPAGEASGVLDLGSGERRARSIVWPSVELQFWIQHRALRGDQMWWRVEGDVPAALQVEVAPAAVTGVSNVPEMAVAVLTRTAMLRFHYVVAEQPPSTDIPADQVAHARSVVDTFVRAKRIRTALRAIAQEDRDGNYKTLAGTAYVSLGAAQRLAEQAWGFEPAED